MLPEQLGDANMDAGLGSQLFIRAPPTHYNLWLLKLILKPFILEDTIVYSKTTTLIIFVGATCRILHLAIIISYLCVHML